MRDLQELDDIAENVKFLKPLEDHKIDYPQDKVIQAVLNKIKSRADLGMVKYGTSMERKDVTTKEWLQHAQEEAMDLANYLERLIQDLK